MKKQKQTPTEVNNELKQRVLRMRKLVTSEEISKAVGCSDDLVRRVLRDERTDYYNIWKTADEMIQGKIRVA
ncbi:hypothetical protein SDC9_156831 [bioreactor metagenome]|uniref:HTH cro/C1-type domain-containing protein n=1 Tax=bioreactor metagenome TaxID=1076179 RepID=A0A645F6N4_9ZZZZ